MKWWNRRLSFVCVCLITSSIAVVSVNVVIAMFINKNSKANNNTSIKDFSNTEDKDIRSFFKDRTVSFSITESQSKKINGTGWLYDWNNQTNQYTFITNLHVFSPYINYNNSKGSFEFNNKNISNINIRLFENENSNDLTLIRTNPKSWNLDNNNNHILIDRLVPNIYKNSIDTYSNNNFTYINNGFVDFIKIVYTDTNDNSLFSQWLHKKRQITEFININEDNINSYNNFYIAGFPTSDNGVKWTEQKIINDTNDNDDIYLSSGVSQLSPEFWINNNRKISITVDNKIKYLRSVSQQIIINDLKMGGGSSGSMLVTKEKDRIKIIGIWWGTYGDHSGAIDLLNSNAFEPYQSQLNDDWKNIYWDGYEI